MNIIHKYNLFLLLVLSLLVVLYFSSEDEGYQALTDQKASSISRINIQSGSQSLGFERVDANWRMPGQVHLRVRQEVIANLLGLLKTHSHRRFEINDQNKQVFGLFGSSQIIRLNEQEFVFGDLDPVQQLRYVMTAGQVHLITDLYSQYLLAGQSFFIEQTPQ